MPRSEKAPQGYFDHATIIHLANELGDRLPQHTTAEIERTVYEIVYGTFFSHMQYIVDPSTPDTTWDSPKIRVEFPADWDSWDGRPELELKPQVDSWIQHPALQAKVLALMTSSALCSRYPVAIGLRQNHDPQILLSPVTVLHIDEKVASSAAANKELYRSELLTEVIKPFRLGGSTGIEFHYDKHQLRGALHLTAFPLTVNFDQRRAFFPIDFLIATDPPAGRMSRDERQMLQSFLVDSLRPPIVKRGGLEVGPRQVPEDLINHEEAAQVAHVSAKTIRVWIDQGALQCYGATRKVSKSELETSLPMIRKRKPRLKSTTWEGRT